MIASALTNNVKTRIFECIAIAPQNTLKKSRPGLWCTDVKNNPSSLSA